MGKEVYPNGKNDHYQGIGFRYVSGQLCLLNIRCGEIIDLRQAHTVHVRLRISRLS